MQRGRLGLPRINGLPDITTLCIPKRPVASRSSIPIQYGHVRKTLTRAGGAAPSMAAVASATAMSAVYAVVGGAMLLYLAGPAAAVGLGVAFAPPAVAAGACAATYGTAYTLLWHPYLPGISCTQAAFRGGSAQERGRGLRTGGGLATVALAPLDEGWVIWGRLPRLGRPARLAAAAWAPPWARAWAQPWGPAACLPRAFAAAAALPVRQQKHNPM